MLNNKEKSYDTHKINSMTSLGKITNKNRTPPFDYWNSQSTPLHPEKKLKNSTHQAAINFDHDPRFMDRDHFSQYNLSPVPSKYLHPIDPNYISNFPSVDESKKILETNTKTQKKKPFKNKQNEENYSSDEDNSLSEEKNNLSENNEKNNQNESVLNIINNSASNLYGSENEIKETNNNEISETDSDPYSKSISNSDF